MQSKSCLLHNFVRDGSVPPGAQHMSCCRQQPSVQEGLPSPERMAPLYSGPQCGSSASHSDKGAPLHQSLPQKFPHIWPDLSKARSRIMHFTCCGSRATPFSRRRLSSAHGINPGLFSPGRMSSAHAHEQGIADRGKLQPAAYLSGKRTMVPQAATPQACSVSSS
eukprot:scaffold54688_cov31-Tisochrysis_lutea.AAC.2